MLNKVFTDMDKIFWEDTENAKSFNFQDKD